MMRMFLGLLEVINGKCEALPRFLLLLFLASVDTYSQNYILSELERDNYVMYKENFSVWCICTVLP